MYFKDLDKTIITFLEYEKSDSTKTKLPEAKAFKEKYMKTKNIMEDINEAGLYKGYWLSNFGGVPYSNVDEMIEKIKEFCNEDGKKYIYAYDDEPDHTMHELGTECDKVKDMIKYRNKICEKMANELEDTVIIIIADHGHTPIENIHLENYPEITKCLLKDTSLEPRATNFFIKPGMKDEFKKAFLDAFSNDFDLYTMEEVIDCKLFGDGEENPIFRGALGDFLAIAKGNKALLHNGDTVLVSQHAGYTDDEILVPLIII